MYELTKVVLTNDLDLMLAHKRSMQVAEYFGISLVQQTSFATAVSEVCRMVVSKEEQPSIVLGLQKASSGKNSIYAKVTDPRISTFDIQHPNLTYARRLVHDFRINNNVITLLYELPSGSQVSMQQIKEGQKLFDELPAVTPYEEAKKLNDRLQQMTNRLGESERKFQVLTNSLPILLLTVTHDGFVVFANKGFMDFSVTDTLAGLKWMHWLGQRNPNIPIHKIEDQMASGQAFSIEVSLQQRTDSDRVWYLLSMNPIQSPSNSNMDWSVFLVNIQAQKVVEATLRDNQELRNITAALEARQKELDITVANLNRSNQELARFAYVASHDLREPARKMAVFSDMLLSRNDSSIPQETSHLLTRIKSGSERMLDVIRDLLNYSSISSDSNVEVEALKLSEIINLAMDQLEMQITESSAEIALEQELTLVGNKRLLSLLFQNLIGNAIKFVNDQITPLIKISTYQITSKDREALGLKEDSLWTGITLSDNGIGFDQKFSERIFEMFQRLHSQSIYQGTGIGLAICKRIVEMHHGHITVKSEPNVGSVFTILLPDLEEQNK